MRRSRSAGVASRSAFSDSTQTLRPLLQAVSKVYVGPWAERALEGTPGWLLGSRRPAWVDVLDFAPQTSGGALELVEGRFRCFDPWDVVGLSLAKAASKRQESELLVALVPGDVLLTPQGARRHLGDRWVRAALVRD